MRLIMFDMDGTLINSGFAISNTINYVRDNMGLKKLKKEYILENLNDPKINSAEFFYETNSFTDEQSRLFEEYYNNNCLKDLVLYNGIKDLVEELKNDFTLSVATNANSLYAKKMLEHVGIEQNFKSIFGYNDVKNPKPHPEMVHKILDKHNILNNNALMVGDSHKDIMAATNAEVDSILVNWGFSNHQKYAIESVKDLRSKIDEKFNI